MEELFLKLKKRSQIIKTILIVNLFCWLFSTILLVIFKKWIILIIISLLCIILSIILGSILHKLSLYFKSVILKESFKEIDENLHFNPKGIFDRHYINESYILTMKTNDCTSSDLLSGKINNHNFKSADILANNKGSDNSDIMLFYGRFYMIDLNYNIKAHIVVRKEKLKFTPASLKLVEFESIELNKSFNVYTSNDLAAFKKIKPQQIQKILDLKRDYKGKLLLAIKNDKLFFGLFNCNNNFELGKCKKYIEVKKMALEEIEFIKRILEIID